MRRLTITLPDDLEKPIVDMKKEDFESSYGQIIRKLIRLGLQSEKGKGHENEKKG